MLHCCDSSVLSLLANLMRRLFWYNILKISCSLLRWEAREARPGCSLLWWGHAWSPAWRGTPREAWGRHTWPHLHSSHTHVDNDWFGDVLQSIAGVLETDSLPQNCPAKCATENLCCVAAGCTLSLCSCCKNNACTCVISQHLVCS